MIALVVAALLSAEPEIELGPAIEVGPTPEVASPVAVALTWSQHLVYVPDAARDEHDLRLGTTLSFGLDWTPGDCWEVALQARVRHHLDVRLATSERDPIGGDLSPEIRRALIRWQGATRSLTLGIDVTRWGKTLARPFDLYNPDDWRDGPLGPEGGERVPTFALTLRQTLGEGELLLSWTPFYFAARSTRPDGPAPEQNIIDSSDLAARITQRLGPLDLALGWMWRLPRYFPGLVSRTTDGRQHVVGLELALTTGPLRWLAEGAFVLDAPVLSPATTRSAPLTRWAFDIAIEPARFVELTLGLEGAHTLDAATTPTYYEGPDDLWLRSRLGLMLAFDGVLRLDLESRIGLLRDDWWLVPMLSLRASDALTLALGAAVYGGSAVDLGLGAVYDDRDEVWLRATYQL